LACQRCFAVQRVTKKSSSVELRLLWFKGRKLANYDITKGPYSYSSLRASLFSSSRVGSSPPGLCRLLLRDASDSVSVHVWFFLSFSFAPKNIIIITFLVAIFLFLWKNPYHIVQWKIQKILANLTVNPWREVFYQANYYNDTWVILASLQYQTWFDRLSY